MKYRSLIVSTAPYLIRSHAVPRPTVGLIEWEGGLKTTMKQCAWFKTLKRVLCSSKEKTKSNMGQKLSKYRRNHRLWARTDRRHSQSCSDLGYCSLDLLICRCCMMSNPTALKVCCLSLFWNVFKAYAHRKVTTYLW